MTPISFFLFSLSLNSLLLFSICSSIYHLFHYLHFTHHFSLISYSFPFSFIILIPLSILLFSLIPPSQLPPLLISFNSPVLFQPPKKISSIVHLLLVQLFFYFKIFNCEFAYHEENLPSVIPQFVLSHLSFLRLPSQRSLWVPTSVVVQRP